MTRLLLLLFLCPLAFAHAQTPWRQLTGLPGGHAETLFEAPSGSIYVFGAAHVYRSTDDGRRWARSFAARSSIRNPTMVATNNGTVLFTATIDDAVQLRRSTDEGATWTRMESAVAEGFTPSLGGL